jgi:hypothetical protein
MVAQDVGITLNLELSLSVAEHQKLLGLVAHPAVRPNGRDQEIYCVCHEVSILKPARAKPEV